MTSYLSRAALLLVAAISCRAAFQSLARRGKGTVGDHRPLTQMLEETFIPASNQLFGHGEKTFQVSSLAATCVPEFSAPRDGSVCNDRMCANARERSGLTLLENLDRQDPTPLLRARGVGEGSTALQPRGVTRCPLYA